MDGKQNENYTMIEGTVEDIVFQSDETGYTVCVIDVNDEPVTMVGTMPALMVGEALRAMGNWTNHPTYGRQFKVNYFEKSMPVDENAMLRYLSSRAIRGVGPKLAGRIVSHFRENTFDVIENHPEFLADIRGITMKKAQEISSSFKAQFGERNVMMFFGNFFGMTTSVRIYKRWGSAAVDIVRQNPYMLCDEIYGIGFERADQMALSLGLPRDSEERIAAGLKFVLRYNASANGHTYLPREKLILTVEKLLGTDAEKVSLALQGLVLGGELIQNDTVEGTPIYLSEYFTAETNAASKLCLLNSINLYGSVSDTEKLIDNTEKQEGITYAPMQRRAIRGAIEHPVTILTGGPGTGKTTIVKAIVNIFREVGMEIALAAPTGRAAKRITSSTGVEAKTIHRLLEMEYSPDEKLRFLRGKNNLLSQDVIIIDELSMVDISVFSALLSAIKPGARLVLIGDSDQLPSVGAGDVLKDIIESGVFPVFCLNEIFRQKGKSEIIENAHRINAGLDPIPSAKDGDFFFMSRSTRESAAQTIASLLRDRLPKTYGEEVVNGIQVVTCTRKGELGTTGLNSLLQSVMNPPSPEKEERRFREVVFREGDKVMQIRNNYDLEWVDAENEENTGLGVFNGDIGKITEIDLAAQTVTCLFDNHKVLYSFEDLEEIEHAFAVTVHKSQGSEYPIVIMPVLDPPPMLSTRNILYTAVTRAQKMVILVGKQESISAMVKNNRLAQRFTGLREMFSVFKEKKQ